MVVSAETHLAGKAQQGYLLHGSPRVFDVLIPHKAHCDSGKRSSNKKAVYAVGMIDKWYSEVSAQLAIAYAVFDKSKAPPNSACTIDAGIMGRGPVFVKITPTMLPCIGPGYVYVLPGAGFKSDPFSIQCYSKKKVVPVEIVPVSPSDYHGKTLLRLESGFKTPYSMGAQFKTILQLQ